MQRVLQATAPTISETFTVDGVATAPSPNTATVTITRADGTILVNATAATVVGGGTFSFTLTTTHTALLDTLTVAWTSSLGTIVETVEVAGGFLFSIAEARAIQPLNNTTTYTTAQITAMRTTVEQAIEDACGVAFVPRYTRETVQGNPAQTDLLLSWPRVNVVRSTVIDGVAVTPLSNVQIRPDGRLNLYLGWTAYTVFPYINAVTVGYEHGYPTPPEPVKRAALLLARARLVTGPIDDRAATFTNADNGGTYSLVTPGRAGSIFGIPEADVIVQQYGLRGSVY